MSSPWVLILASQGSQHDLPGLRHHSVGVSVTSADDRIGPEAAGRSRLDLTRRTGPRWQTSRRRGRVISDAVRWSRPHPILGTLRQLLCRADGHRGYRHDTDCGRAAAR